MESSTASITPFPRLADPRRRGCQTCLFWLEKSGCCHCDGRRCQDASAAGTYRFWRAVSGGAARAPRDQRTVAHAATQSAVA